MALTIGTSWGGLLRGALLALIIGISWGEPSVRTSAQASVLKGSFLQVPRVSLNNLNAHAAVLKFFFASPQGVPEQFKCASFCLEGLLFASSQGALEQFRRVGMPEVRPRQALGQP